MCCFGCAGKFFGERDYGSFVGFDALLFFFTITNNKILTFSTSSTHVAPSTKPTHPYTAFSTTMAKPKQRRNKPTGSAPKTPQGNPSKKPRSSSTPESMTQNRKKTDGKSLKQTNIVVNNPYKQQSLGKKHASLSQTQEVVNPYQQPKQGPMKSVVETATDAGRKGLTNSQQQKEVEAKRPEDLPEQANDRPPSQIDIHQTNQEEP